MLYKALIYPHLIYCIVVWGSAKTSHLNKLLIQQKRAVRLCTASSFRAPSDPLFSKLKLLKIMDIYNVYTALFMFKIKCNNLPTACMSLVSLNVNESVYSLRSASIFQIKNYRTVIRENSIAVRGPKLWDSLPLEIQYSSSIYTVKKYLTAYYLSAY